MITIQNYVRVKSVEEAYALNQNKRNRVIGGMMWLRMGSGSVNTAIDLCDLGLDAIEETDEAFVIGAMTPLRKLELHEGLNRYTGDAVRHAVKDIVGVQFRNMATVGGSLWGRFGFSDVLTVLLSMDCQVELHQAGIVPLADFVSMPHDRDILVRLIIKKTPGKFVYQAVRAQRTDFPVITCAVSEMQGVYCAAIGARPGMAVLVRDEEGILAGGVTPQSAKDFAAYAAQHAPTQGNVRGSAQYRTHLIRVLTERAALQLGERK